MLKFLKRKEHSKEVVLKSICNGKVIPIEKIPDKMFANKLLGDGIGFEFDGNSIYSPCSGEVVMIANTNHAFGIKLENGAEILIHCGLNTVNLNGKGLKPLVNVGDHVKVGERILEVDVELFNQKQINLVTPVVLTSGNGYDIKFIKNDSKISLDDDVIKIIKN